MEDMSRHTVPARRWRRLAAPAWAAVLGSLLVLSAPAQPGLAMVADHRVHAETAADQGRGRTDDGAGVLALNWGDLDATPRAWKGDYIIMQPWEYDRIPAYRAKNPDVKILMYKDVSATRRQSASVSGRPPST